jgi:threonine synthase
VELPDTIKGPLGCMGFSATTISNGDTLAEMRRIKAETGWAICPHTAVGTQAASRAPLSTATDIVLSTAHAAKFPETVEEATGERPGLPTRCVGALGAEEHFSVLPAEQGAVREYILKLAAGR